MMFETLGFIGSAILNAIIGSLVFSRGVRKPINQAFFVIALCLAMWSIGLFFTSHSTGILNVLWWNRIAFAGPMLLPAAFLFFSYTFPHQRKMSPLIKIMLWVGIGLFFLFPFTVIGIDEMGGIQNGWVATMLLPIYYITYFFLVLVNFSRSYKETEKEGRTQFKFFFVGVAITLFISAISNIVLPVVFNTAAYNAIGPASTVVMMLLTMYAILKHRLFEVKLLAIETLVGVIALIFVVEVVLADTAPQRIFRVAVFSVFLVVSIPLLKAAYREQHLVKRQYEMMAVVSHQLRTPLTAIVGFAALLDEMVDPKSKEQDTIDKLLLSTKRLQSTINDFLKLFELEEGKSIPKSKLSIQYVVESSVELLRNEFETKGLELVVQMPKKPVYVMADRSLLSEVVSNILHNAWRYTKEGSVHLNVSAGNDVVITVSDSGIGLTQSEKDQLFQKFFRGDAAKKVQPDGSGLGLMIVREIMQMYGGSITAESAGRNQGTTFTLRLPRTRD